MHINKAINVIVKLIIHSILTIYFAVYCLVAVFLAFPVTGMELLKNGNFDNPVSFLVREMTPV